MKDIKQKAEEYTVNMNLIEKIMISSSRYMMKKILINAVLYGVELATKWNSPDEKPEKKLLVNGEVLIKSENRIYFGMYIRNKWHTFYEGKWRETEIDGWQYLPPINQ